jgi:Raf kinase inhibitor-like YbhB/YbcL family protein
MVAEVGPEVASDGPAGAFTFTSSTLRMMGANLVFPASTSAPMNQSPAFAWSGAPAGTMSFVITLKDLQGDTHWALWDIPADTTMIAAGLPRGTVAVPAGAKQKAIYGDMRGYEGPGAPAPPHEYEFQIWALKVATLPANVASQSPAQMRSTGLPAQLVSPTATVIFKARGQRGGL